MKNNIIAIVTPVGNEIESIEVMYDKLCETRPDTWHRWITVIDSSCQDGSEAILRKLAQYDSRIIVLHIGQSAGLAAAYIRGIQHAIKLNAAKIIEVDVGHPVHLIEKFVEALNNFPLVVGTRVKGGKFINVPLRRRLLSKIGTLLSHLVLQLPFTDCTSGLQGFTRQVAKAIPFEQFQSTGHFYQTEFKFYCQSLPFMEIPFIYVGTKSSIKILAIKESLYVLFYLLKQRRYLLLPGNYTPISDNNIELLTSIQQDLKQLIGNEKYIISHCKLQLVVNRIIARLVQLIEKELK